MNEKYQKLHDHLLKNVNSVVAYFRLQHSWFKRALLAPPILGFILIYSLYNALGILFLKPTTSFTILTPKNQDGTYKISYHSHKQFQRKTRLFSLSSLAIIILSVVSLQLISSVVYFRTLAANPAFTGTIANILITEDATTSNAIDLDNYFTPDAGESCTYSSPDGFSLGSMSIDIDGTVDITSAATSGGSISMTSVGTQTALLLHGDGDNASTVIPDTGAYGNVVTANGNAQISTAQSKFGSSSMYFDGTGDYFAVPDSSSFTLGTGAFTIEAWIKTSDTQGEIVGHFSPTAPYPGFLFGVGFPDAPAAGKLSFYAADGVASQSFNSTATVNDGNWHHVAVVRSNNTITFYIDGTASGGGTLSTVTTIAASSYKMHIGASTNSPVNREYAGYIDDLRIIKGTAVYTAGFTAPSAAFDDVGFTSRIVDATSSTSWNTLAWTPAAPYGKNLPNNASIETAYSNGNADMTGNKLLMHFDENSASNSSTITDNSGTSHNGTVTTDNGSTNKISANGKLNNAITFDGTGDYISVADHADFTLGSNNFTLETWVKFNSVGNAIFVGHDNGGGNTNKWIFMYESGKLRFHINPGGLYPIDYSWTPTAGQWYHLAITRNSSAYTLYINGSSVSTGSNGTAIPDPTASLTIGQAEGIYYFNGVMDELALYKGDYLSATEVLDHYKRGAMNLRYQVRSCDDSACSGESFIGPGSTSTSSNTTSDFDAADEANYTQEDATNGTDFTSGQTQLHQSDTETKLLLHGDGSNNSTTFTDSSVNARTVTVNGNTKISTDQSKFGGSSMYFDGNGDYLSVASSNDWILSNTWTMETWVYPTSYNASYNTLYSWVPGSWLQIFLDGSGRVKIGTQPNGEQTWTDQAASLNQWSHIAIVSNAGNVTVYINGVSAGTKSVTIPTSGSASALIGWETSASRAFTGYMDEFRITKGLARYGNFTPSSTALTSDVNTSVLLHGDGSNGGTTFTDSSANARSTSNVTGVTTDTTTKKFGTASMKFTGQGGATATNSTYLEYADSVDWELNNGDFTIEFWMYPTDVSVSHVVFSQYSGGGAGKSVQLSQDNSTLSFSYSTTGSDDNPMTTASGTLVANTWYHVAVVRSGTTNTIYVDGVAKATQNIGSSTIANGIQPFRIGARSVDAFYGFSGYIDDFRFSKGIARYTPGFTPPSSALTNPGYPTAQAYYVTTASATTFSLTNVAEINSVTITNTQPTNTSIKALVSFDGRSTWKYYSSGAWQTASGGLADLQTSGMTISAMESAFTNWVPTTEASLDFAFDLATTDTSVTPNVDLITINYDSSTSGSTNTFYSELTNNTVGLPSLSLNTTNNIANNRYFQYKAFFSSENSSYLPMLSSVSAIASNGTYTHDENTAGELAGGTYTGTAWSKPASDTVTFQCTDDTAESTTSNTVYVYYPHGTFTSSQTGNWNVGTTWGGTCTSGCFPNIDYPAGEDVVVSSGHTVTVPNGTTANFNTLTTAGILVLAGNIGTATDITIQNGGIVQQENTTQQIISGTLDVQVGGTLNHTTNTTTNSYNVNFSVADATISGTVNTTGRGFQGGSGTAPAASSSGGAHGGYGGGGSGGGENQAGYGDALNPSGLGSGGGNWTGVTGGNGGGSVRIVASDYITVTNASIVANGNTGTSTSGSGGYAAGGGAGGSIYLNAAGNLNLSGSTITTNGATGASANTRWGGGGGGGRITFVHGGLYTAPTTLSSSGGSGPSSAADGGAGSIFIDSSSNDGILTYDNNASTEATGSRLQEGVNYTAITELVLKNNANLTIPATTTLTTNQSTFNTSSSAATLSVSGTFNPNTNDGVFTIPNNFTLILSNTGTLANVTTPSINGNFTKTNGSTDSFGTVTVGLSGIVTMDSYTNASSAWSLTSLIVYGTLRHTDNPANSSTFTHKVKLSADNLTVASSGTINVDGKGYSGSGSGTGSGPGGGTRGGAVSSAGGGGSHAGTGGTGSGNFGGTGGSIYGSASAPIDHGSGGGAANNGAAGGDGGGSIELTITNAITIDGSISAKGDASVPSNGNTGGGGSGGSIYITAGNVTGTGTIDVSGGLGGNGTSSKGGGGGGGRISINGLSGSNSFAGTHIEAGGTATASATAGTAGVYYQGNITPVVAFTSVTQQTNDGYVDISYTLQDGNNENQTLNLYEYSTDNASWSTMSAATGDGNHQGIASLSSDGTGISHTFVWNVCANIVSTYDATVYVRLRANDGTIDSATSSSSAFVVDCAAPIVSTVAANQIAGTTNVNFNYNMSDDATTDVTVALDIDHASGTGSWNVNDTSLTGHIGSAQTTGNGKAITWNAGANADNVDSATYQVRIRATDKYQNTGSNTSSADFALDTKDPVGLASLTAAQTQADRIVLSWTAATTETNFDHYEIWYGTTTAAADNRTGTEWDYTDDAALATLSTATTTITSLNPAVNYYFKIWAVDDYSNEVTLDRLSAATTGVIPIIPTASAPIDGQTNVNANVTITASAYSSTLSSTHLNTDWQISDDGTFSDDCSDPNVVWCKLGDTTNKTNVVVNSTNGTFQNALLNRTQLKQNTLYYCRMRYSSDTGGQSSWSQTITFRVGNSSPTVNTTTFPSSVSLLEDSSGASAFDLDAYFVDTDDACTYSIIDNPEPNVVAAINSSNVVSFTPAANYNGAESIQFRCTDSQGATVDSPAMTLSVQSVNDVPTVDAGSDVTVDNTQDSITLQPTIGDVDGDALTYTWAIIESTHIGGCGLSDFDVETPLLLILERIASGYTCTIQLTVSDGTTSISDIIIISVEAGESTDESEEAEFTGSLPNLSLPAGTRVTTFDLDDYFIAAEGVTLTYSVSGNNRIEVVINDDGSVQITIPDDFVGTETIIFRALTPIGDIILSNPIVITIEPVLDNNDALCGTTVLRDIALAKGASHGKGIITLYSGGGEQLRRWKAFNEAGVIPSLTSVNGNVRVFGIKSKTGTTVHVYNACGRVIKKKQLSPKLHWRRFALGEFDGSKVTKEIVTATQRQHNVYLKIYSYNDKRKTFRLERRTRTRVLRRHYYLIVKQKTVLLYNRNDELVSRWKIGRL